MISQFRAEAVFWWFFFEFMEKISGTKRLLARICWE